MTNDAHADHADLARSLRGSNIDGSSAQEIGSVHLIRQRRLNVDHSVRELHAVLTENAEPVDARCPGNAVTVERVVDPEQ